MNKKLLDQLYSKRVLLLDTLAKKERPDLEGKRILLLDDDPEIHTLMKNFLSSYQNVTLLCYKEEGPAVNCYLGGSVDLLIIDLELSTYFGTDITKALRVITSKNVPTIYISSNKNYRDIVESRYSSTEEFILKPLVRKSFLEKLSKKVGLMHIERAS